MAASVKERELAASFEDHFSHARLFYLSLSEVEREHVAQAYTFELGKCFEQNIRERQLRKSKMTEREIDEEIEREMETGEFEAPLG